MAAQPETVQEDQQSRKSNGPDRRAYPRHKVDCAAVVSAVSWSMQIWGRVTDVSLGGCRVVTDQRYTAGILVRVEVQFQLRGVAFRFAGVIVGSREARCFAVRFLDVPARRWEELAEVLAEVAQANASALLARLRTPPEILPITIPAVIPVAVPVEVSAALRGDPPQDAVSVAHSVQSHIAPKAPSAASDRRSHRRHGVDTSVRLLLIKGGICMPGRIVNLSLGGCRIRTQEQFKVGIYVRVEAEFQLHGLPFRVGGVSQAIQDKNTIGVRFLDVSERKRRQLTELIAEIAEAFEEAAGERGAGDKPAMTQ
ncbi:PilZ domain-containing protein [Acidicapsa acidisoli]|uniref:PilZ domain-containing protein n=1 Tax=Acidicapsa acidisoli TaxID=1615681 RepID=UPI0021E026AA|nr:PilZ domain-containing protein [Acidicapsa acidisoli]